MSETSVSTGPSVAVVGAGLSGLICARRLADAGCTVRVFEKSRGPGGRTATRRDGRLRFDHGAQYFTARDPRFSDQVRRWRRDGLVAEWRGRLGVARDGEVTATANHIERWVGVPGMNALCRSAADSLDVSYRTRVGLIEESAGRLRLTTEDGDDLGRHDWVVVSAPPAQTSELLRSVSPKIASRADSVTMAPCWAVMVAFDRPLDLPFDGVFVNSGQLSWIARNSSKPHRPAELDAWILHGHPEWSSANIELRPDEAARELISAFTSIVGQRLDPVHLGAHRWRYALPVEPLPESCLTDNAVQIAACGDWCGGPRVEGAYLSGLAAAGRILGG